MIGTKSQGLDRRRRRVRVLCCAYHSKKVHTYLPKACTTLLLTLQRGVILWSLSHLSLSLERERTYIAQLVFVCATYYFCKWKVVNKCDGQLAFLVCFQQAFTSRLASLYSLLSLSPPPPPERARSREPYSTSQSRERVEQRKILNNHYHLLSLRSHPQQQSHIAMIDTSKSKQTSQSFLHTMASTWNVWLVIVPPTARRVFTFRSQIDLNSLLSA